MQRIAFYSFLIASCSLLLFSCGRSDKAALGIPKEAGIVVHVNTSALSSKLSWQEIKANSWFKQMAEHADDSLTQRLLDNPASSGINTDGDLYFFTVRRGNGSYMATQGLLKDAAAFETTLKNSKQGTVSKEGDMNVFKSEKAVVTWTADRFMCMMDMPFGRPSTLRLDPDKRDYDAKDLFPGFPADSLLVFSKELYARKNTDLLNNDNRFSGLLKEKGDLHLWSNAEYLYDNRMGDMLSMINTSILFKGNATGATVNFENGKVIMQASGYYNEELSNLMKKYPMKKIESDAFNRLPSQNVAAVFAMNYPPEGLKEFLTLLKVDGWINGFMGKMDYSLDEFIKANKGDLLITVSDLEMPQGPAGLNEPDGPVVKVAPKAKILFAASVNDKPSFEKLIGIAQRAFEGDPSGGNNMKIFGSEVRYQLTDKWFVLGNAEEQVGMFISGGNNTKADFISRINNHPFGAFVDLQKIIKASATAAKDSNSMASLQLSEKLWQDAVITSGEFSNGALHSTVEANLVDKNTNSLKQLNQYFDQMAALRKKD